MPRFVLEIGTEELPPRYFPPALSQLYEGGEAMLARARLTHRGLKVYGTPRRLVLIVKDMAAVQDPAIREERGPSAKVAFDAEGKPTKAAAGFARRQGIAPEDLVRRQTDQGEYVFAVIHEPEAPAKDALAALLPDLITGISFPKSMRWGAGTIRFGRPIRWILALVDDEVVEFAVGEVHSGRLARGHPVLADGMFAIQHAKDYESALEEQFVIVEPDRRLHELNRQLDEISREQTAAVLGRTRWFSDPIASLVRRPEAFAMDMAISLSMQTTFLVEYPTVGVGSFDERFLGLPRPVLVTEMEHVQSYFPLEGRDGKLLPRFIAVRDGGSDHMDAVIAGWENVLKAKLIDASYFYEQDKKKPLADRVEDLRGVMFQEQLGTMYEKTERVRAIVADCAVQLSLPAETARALDHAAKLCKADLTSMVVKELSDLQGVMGADYARLSGESDDVADAIEQHYWPRSARADIPRKLLGRVLAVADRLDTIAAWFAIGAAPTGSADPYGLRREGGGIVAILTTAPDVELSRIDSGRLVRQALDALCEQVGLTRPKEDVATEVMGFLRQRLAVALAEREVRYDLINAALAIDTDIRDTALRAFALKELVANRDFMPTVVASTRVSNIAKGFPGGHVQPDLFQHESESALWSVCSSARSQILELEAYRYSSYIQEGLFYREYFSILTTLRAPIDDFFNDVLVMAEDPEVRNNRLALCWQINQLFWRLADLTLVVQA